MTESQLHLLVCNYIRVKYPTVLFHSDFAAGVKLTIGQATRNRAMQSGSGWPDLFIPEPRNGKYGLFIELKKADTTIYLKNGELVSNPHIREQAEVLNLLESKGYVATFAVGFSEVEKILAEYLNPAHSALQA